MALTDGQRDNLLRQIAQDLRTLVHHLIPEEEQPRRVVKKDPNKLYGGNGQ